MDASSTYPLAILKTLTPYHIFKAPLADMALKFSKMALAVRLGGGIALYKRLQVGSQVKAVREATD